MRHNYLLLIVLLKQSYNHRKCPDILKCNYNNSDKLRVTFTLNCDKREVLDWIAINGGYTSKIVMDIMVYSISKRFYNRLSEVLSNS